MPSGYTADIAKGISFEEYALVCARAFGALITMRDEPSGAPIPEEFQPSSFYADRLASAQTELKRVIALTPADIEKEAAADHQSLLDQRTQRIERAVALHAKYTSMRLAVQLWTPPSPEHYELKSFMLEQIESSVSFDCDLEYDLPPPQQSASEWLADKVDELRLSIARYTKENGEEIERAAKRTSWVKDLRASLKAGV
jgi:hypothetical protein